MNRLQKYSLSSHGLAMLSGILGQISLCSAAINALDTGNLISGFMMVEEGEGDPNISGEYVAMLNLSQSSVSNDTLQFTTGYSYFIYDYFLSGFADNGAKFISDGMSNSFDIMKYFAPGSIVDNHSTNTTTAYFSFNNPIGDWVVDRPNGAIGFINGDGEFGYIFVDWVASTKTLTFLGAGFFDDTPGTGITVVPEPSEFAAALGLGAIGVAYYRRRSGNKTRPKN